MRRNRNWKGIVYQNTFILYGMVELRRQGKSWREIAKVAGKDYHNVRRAVLRQFKRDAERTPRADGPA